jgi:hypothetical protein
MYEPDRTGGPRWEFGVAGERLKLYLNGKKVLERHQKSWQRRKNMRQMGKDVIEVLLIHDGRSHVNAQTKVCSG